MIITPLAKMITPEQIPSEALAEIEIDEEWARRIVAMALNAWPNANKAQFAQGPCLMLPVPK